MSKEYVKELGLVELKQEDISGVNFLLVKLFDKLIKVKAYML